MATGNAPGRRSYDERMIFEVINVRTRFLIFAWAILLPLPAFADTPADFSGEWVLSGNGQSRADSASTQDSDHSSSSSPGSGGHGGGHGGGMGGMGGGGHHGRHSQDTSDANAGTNAAVPAVPRLNAQALIIRQSDMVFDIDADGRRMAYRFDNRHNYGPIYGGTVTLTWTTPEMVIETHPDTGGTIEEHYTLSPDGRKLTLRIHQQRAGANDDDAHDITRVFVRNADDAKASSTNQPMLPP